MNRELIQEWVKALRSGEYEQCTGQLTRDGAFCCLGVLASIKANSRDPYDICRVAGSEVSIRDYTELSKEACMTKKVPWDQRQWPYVATEEFWVSCWRMNDSHGKTFPEIADYIEKVLLSDN